MFLSASFLKGASATNKICGNYLAVRECVDWISKQFGIFEWDAPLHL